MLSGAVAAAAALAVAAPAAQAVPSAQAHLASVARKAPSRKVVAIAQFKGRVGERQARKLVRAHHGTVTGRLPLIHGLALKISARQAAYLGHDKHVASLTLNTKVKAQGTNVGALATTYPVTVGADQLWAKGITGKGVGVAVVDSGLSGDTPDFKAADGTSRIAANVIVNPDAKTPNDPVGHGTHVAGIIAGNGNNRPATDPDSGRYVGIAPDADLIALKIADEQGNSTVLDAIDAVQFAVEHRQALNIRVLNLSISADTPASYLLDPLDAAVEAAWKSGIVVVSAAGNRGDAADAVQYAPGNDPFVISVGGMDEMGTANTSDDTLADWSSRGVTQDGVAKPDVVAPGAHMISTLAAGSMFQQLCPACVIGSSYLQISGTSMAAPVVSGAAALLLQARPDLTPDQVKELLVNANRSTAAKVRELGVDIAVNTQAGKGANQGIVPNPQVTGLLSDVVAILDPTRATWSRATWSRATWSRATWSRATWSNSPMTAQWAKATWTCYGCQQQAPANAWGKSVSSTRSTWSRSTWSSVLG